MNKWNAKKQISKVMKDFREGKLLAKGKRVSSRTEAMRIAITKSGI